MSITYAALCDAVADSLRSISIVKTVESFDEISESIGAVPTLHVYPDSGDVGDGDTDRSTFNANVRVTTLTIKIDAYARARSHIMQDIAAQVALIDAIDTRLSAQTGALYGSAYIRAHHWSWERGTLSYANKDYASATFTLKLTIF